MILNHIGLVILSLVVGHASGQILLIAADRVSNSIDAANLWLVLNNANYLILLQFFKKMLRRGDEKFNDTESGLLKHQDSPNRHDQKTGELKIEQMGMGNSPNTANFNGKDVDNNSVDIEQTEDDKTSIRATISVQDKWKSYPIALGTFESIFTIILYILGLGTSRFLSIPILYGTNPVLILPNPESEEYGTRLYVNETGDSLINAQFTNQMYAWAHFYDEHPLHPNGRPSRVNELLSSEDIMMGLYSAEMAKQLKIEEEFNNQSISLYDLEFDPLQQLKEAAFYYKNHSLINTGGFSTIFRASEMALDSVPVPFMSIPNGSYTSRLSNVFKTEPEEGDIIPITFEHSILRQLLVDKEYFTIDTYDPLKSNYYKLSIYYMYYARSYDFGGQEDDWVKSAFVGLINGTIEDGIMTTEMIHFLEVTIENTTTFIDFEDSKVNGVPWLDLLTGPKLFSATDHSSFTHTNSEMDIADFYLFSCGTHDTRIIGLNSTTMLQTNKTVDDYINCTAKYGDSSYSGVPVHNPLYIRYKWLHQHKNITVENEISTEHFGFATKPLYFKEIDLNGTQRYHLPKNSNYKNIETKYIISNAWVGIMCSVIAIWLLLLCIPTLKRSSTIIFIEEQAKTITKPFLDTIFSKSHSSSNVNSSNLL